jgi:hypothetical protein
LTYCGDDILYLEDLRKIWDAIPAHKSEKLITLDPLTRETRGARELLTNIGRRSASNASPQSLNTFNLPDQIRHREATYPRDRIYSILAMASDREEINLRPDYALEVRHVYTAVAERIRRISRNLNEMDSTRFKCTISGLPSWVPDWSPDNQSGFITRSTRRSNFNASEDFQIQVQYLDTNCALRISGIEFDCISAAGPVATFRNTYQIQGRYGMMRI